MKRYYALFFILIISYCHSQQTEGLRIIKEKYAPEFERILSRYSFIDIKKLSRKELDQLNRQKQSELNSLEFKRNEDYLLELTKIKSNPSVVNFDPKSVQPTEEKGEISPKYPTGINGFKKEIIDKFYLGNIEAKGKINSELTFVIEKDGSVVNVQSTGTNDDFNRQTELAIYLTEFRWEPATIDGYPARYRFRLPLTLNFD